jgi:hypothetical protein
VVLRKVFLRNLLSFLACRNQRFHTLLVLGMSCAPVAAQTADVPPELWDRPRTGALVLGQESIGRVVAAGLAEPDAQIVIHHPAGQEPQIQAEELRSWLGALAIDPRRVILRSGLASGAPMKMELVR